MSAQRRKKRSETYKGQRKALLVRLPSDVFDKIGEFCELGGVTRNEFISGVLVDAMPQLQAVTEAVRAAKASAGGASARTISSALSKALADLQTKASDAQFELGLHAGSGGGKGAPAGGGTTPAKRPAVGRVRKGSLLDT